MTAKVKWIHTQLGAGQSFTLMWFHCPGMWVGINKEPPTELGQDSMEP